MPPMWRETSEFTEAPSAEFATDRDGRPTPKIAYNSSEQLAQNILQEV